MCNRLDCTTCRVVPTVGYVESCAFAVVLVKVDERTLENEFPALCTIHFGAAFLTVASTASCSSCAHFSTPLLVKILQLRALAQTFLVLCCQLVHRRSYFERKFPALGAQALCRTPLTGTGFWQIHALLQVPKGLIVFIYLLGIYARRRARRRMHAPLAQPLACACACACSQSTPVYTSPSSELAIFPHKKTETIAWQLTPDMRAYAQKETANPPGVPLLRLEGSLDPAHLGAAATLPYKPYSSANETAAAFTEQLRMFANGLVRQKPTDSPWSASNIAACVQHAISLMDSAAGENWGELFRLNVRYPLQLDEYVNVFLVQFSSNMVGEEDEFEPPTNKVQVQESIVARLVLRIQLHKAPTPHKVSVSMESGQTAVCVRCMHLGTLLRACALLVAQQIAYLGSPSDPVLFKGDPVSEGTRRIYGKLFMGLGDAQEQKSMTMMHQDDSCHQMAVRLWNPGMGIIPQSIMNVSERLWHWYTQSAYMCGGALPPQIRQYKEEACECGTRRKKPPVAHEEQQVHAADGQACVSVYGGCAPPPLHFAAAALPLWTWYGNQAWMYKNSPLPAQIRHLSPSRAPAASGPVPAVCHRAPAQMFFTMHQLYEYRDYRLFIPEINPDTYAENWNHVLRCLPDINLEYETIERWPNGRLMCFCIWWKYTWDGLQAPRSASDRDTMHEKLKHALLCEHIPGVSIEDFFKIKPAQIADSHAPMEYVRSGPRTGIHMPSWISHGVYCCEIAEHAEHENTTVQNDNIFNKLLLFFILQTEYDSTHYDNFSTKVVVDAFEHLAAEWGGEEETPTHSEMGHADLASVPSGRRRFSGAFQKLQAKYNEDNKSVKRDEIWSLICAPPKVNAQVRGQVNVY
jgi:hypothetical protein